MRRLGLVALTLVILLLQIGLLPALRPFGVVPNVVLVLVALLSLYGSASVALVAAVGCGIAVDLSSGANFGIWTALLVLAALAGGLLRRAGVEVSGPLAAVGVVASGTILMAIAIWVSAAGAVSSWPIAVEVRSLGVELLLNVMLTLLLRPLVRLVVPSSATNIAMVG